MRITGYTRRKDKVIILFDKDDKQLSVQEFKTVNAAKKANRGNMQPNIKKK